jgi:hypothetical protein
MLPPVPRYSVWIGDLHLATPWGLRFADAPTALRWAQGYSRVAGADVMVMEGARTLAVFRDGARSGAPAPPDAEPRVIDRRTRPSLANPAKALATTVPGAHGGGHDDD